MGKESLKTNLAICILLFVNCSLWLFEGIIGWKKITLFVIFFGLIILFTRKWKPLKNSFIWLLYPASIILSLLNQKKINNWLIYMFLMYMAGILFVIFVNNELSIFKTGIIFLTIIGIINSLMVLVHFIFKDTFNSAYFPYLQHNGSLNMANVYYDRGYYFGFNYKPHEVAGIITFAIAAILIWGILQTEFRKKVILLIPLGLSVPLLLTGKKGIIICLFVTFMLVLLMHYAAKKQWKKIALTVTIAVILIIVAIMYIMTHLDNPLFYRFAAFFSKLISGETADSGRGELRAAAIQLWNENKMFGVGWFQFNGYTVSRFGFSRTHSVNLDYLQFLCETGIIGFVMMITPILVMIRRTLIVWHNTLKSVSIIKTQWIILFAVFVQIFIILYAFIEVPFYNTMYFTIYMFSCVIINNAYARLSK